MIANIDRLFAVATAKLCDIRHRCVIQSPERVLVERFDAFLKANFDAI
jgi:hypothetical protein